MTPCTVQVTCTVVVLQVLCVVKMNLNLEVPYFSIDNAHHKLFTLYFYLSFVITFDLPLIPF